MKTPTSLFGASLLALSISASVSAQSIVVTVPGSASPSFKNNQNISQAGDINGDGVSDLLVGSHLGQYFDGRGMVQIFDGLTGALLRTHHGTYKSELGYSTASVGDVDGDGVDDYAVGAPGDRQNGYNAGAIYLYSGLTGSIIGQYSNSPATSRLGESLAAIGDLDGDGRVDLVAGAPQHKELFPLPFGGFYYINRGRALILGGGGLNVIHEVVGIGTGTSFGFSAAGTGDMNGDGIPDFAVSAPKSSISGPFSGSVYTYSGADGAQLGAYHSGIWYGEMGRALTAGKDLNQDGVNDLLMGSGKADIAGADAGRIALVSGSSMTTLWSMNGDSAFDNFGHALQMLRDVDGDGHDDFAVGIPGSDLGGFNAGRTTVFSGATGGVVDDYQGTAGAYNGNSLAADGDHDGDGLIDLLIGSSGAYTAGKWTGTVDVVSHPATTIQIDLDLTPGSDDNTINLKSKGKVSIALLSSDQFDTGLVDVATVRFAEAFVSTNKHGKPRLDIYDVNGDGRDDLVLYFEVQDMILTPGTSEVELAGSTIDGQDFAGTSTVLVKA